MEKNSRKAQQTGWQKKTKNPTTNAKMDPHKYFCRRCHSYNKGCPNPGGPKNCSL